MHNNDNVTEPGGEQHHHHHLHHPPINRNIAMGQGVGPPPSSNTGGSTAAAGGGISSSVSAAPNPGGAAGGIRECAGCGKRITERFLLKALDLFWHEDCLKCGCCDCRLGEVGSTLYTKANLILCKRDYLRLFGTTGYCAACNKVIPAFEMVMRAKSNVYHLECFACQQCNHRFCVGDRFYLCDNKILCEYDYEERLVFANMAYNPSSLAHIRRQVSNLQPAGDNMSYGMGGRMSSSSVSATLSSTTTSSSSSSSASTAVTSTSSRHHQQQQQQQFFGVGGIGSVVPSDKLPLPLPPNGSGIPPSNMGPHRDDGSSGYGSPDSETFESPQAQ